MPKSSKVKGYAPDVYDDKPDFAHDMFHPESKRKTKAEPAKADDSASVHLRERLGQGALSGLEKLKRDMESAAEKAAQKATAPVTPVKRNAPPHRHPGSQGSDDGLTFAEMFDPQPDDDRDFASLLDDSKQDWREYK